MIEIKHILDEKPIGGQDREEEFVDPLPHTFAYRNVLPWGRSGMANHDYAHVRQAPRGFQPTSIKQLDSLTAVHPRHACCGWMRQHALDLGMLQELIASASRNALHTCQDELPDDGHIAILPVEAHQRHLC